MHDPFATTSLVRKTPQEHLTALLFTTNPSGGRRRQSGEGCGVPRGAAPSLGEKNPHCCPHVYLHLRMWVNMHTLASTHACTHTAVPALSLFKHLPGSSSASVLQSLRELNLGTQWQLPLFPRPPFARSTVPPGIIRPPAQEVMTVKRMWKTCLVTSK